MADEKIRYVLDVDDKGTPKLVKFGQAAEKSGKQAEKSFGGMGQKLQDVGGQIPQLGGAMSALSGGPMVAAAAAAALVVGGFALMVSRSIEAADSMNDLSLRLGVSTEQLSVLSLYAEQSGTDIDTLASAMGKLGVKLANGDKGMKDLGITANTADEALFQVADAVAKAENPMDRLKIATDAFGKSGQQMLPLLVQGGDALREMGSSAPVVSTELAKMADEYNDKMAEVKGQFGNIANQITEAVMPAMLGFADLMMGVAQYAKDAAHWFGIMSAGQAREDERNAIVDQYAELMKLKKEAVEYGSMSKADLKKPILINGKGIVQALKDFDAETARIAAERLGPTPPPITGGGGDGAKKKEKPYEETFQLVGGNHQYGGADVDKAAAAFAERQKQATSDRLAAIENENREAADLSKRLNDNAAAIIAAEKAKADAVAEGLEKQEELRALEIEMHDEKIKMLKDEADAYEKNMASQLGMNNGALTEMIRGKQSFAETSAQIDDTMKNYAIQKGLEFVEQWIAQQITMMLFGDAVKAAEAAKAVALGATQAAAYAPAAALASTASFGGAAVAGGAALAAVLASFAFADRGSSTLQGGRRMIVGENRAEEFRPTVPGNIHNNTTNYGAVNVTVQGGGDARAIAREIVRAQRMAGANNYGGSH